MHRSLRSTGQSARIVLLLGAVFGAGCGDGGAAPPDDGEPLLKAIRGNGQITSPETELPALLTVHITSARGKPRAGVPVGWSIPEEGTLAPLQLVTDDSGMARASWTLGSRPGRYAAVATVGSREIPFHATASEPITLGDMHRMSFVPSIMSNEFVHPDVVRVPRGWGAARRFLAITPYPGGNVQLEQPSVYASGEFAEWEVPDGLTNPVQRRPAKGYLSDPDVVFEPDRRELWMYYRQVIRDNTILLTTSGDGIRWNDPIVVARAPNHMIVSPAVVRVKANDWHMWSVNAGSAGCASESTFVEHRTSTDGLHWSSPTPVTFRDAAMPAWHIDVTWVPEFQQYWALFNGKPKRSCSTPALYLATSADGIVWETRQSPVLTRGAIPDFDDIVYRSSLLYQAASDVVTIWYSGARYVDEQWIWRTAVQRLPRETLFPTGPQLPIVLRREPRVTTTAPPLLRAP